MGHRGTDLHRQPLERLRVEPHQEDALRRTDIQSLVEGRHILADAQFGDAVGLHPDAVVAAQAVVRPEPDESLLVLHDIAHGISRQPIVHRDVPTAIVPTCPRGQ